MFDALEPTTRESMLLMLKAYRDFAAPAAPRCSCSESLRIINRVPNPRLRLSANEQLTTVGAFAWFLAANSEMYFILRSPQTAGEEPPSVYLLD